MARSKNCNQGNVLWRMDLKQQVADEHCANILFEIREDGKDYFKVFYYGVCCVYCGTSFDSAIAYVYSKLGGEH